MMIQNHQIVILFDLIAPSVMECYFREHMAERDLFFHDTLAPHLAAYDPEASEAQQRDFLIGSDRGDGLQVDRGHGLHI